MTFIPPGLSGRSQDLALYWDFDNRMTSADLGDDSSIEVSHKYDALGRRVARTEDMTTTLFVQFGQQTICDYPVGAAPALSTYRYLHASYIDEPVMRWETAEDEPVYYHRNQQYSIIALTDDSCDIIERYSYTAYGEPAFFNGSKSQISESQIDLLILAVNGTPTSTSTTTGLAWLTRGWDGFCASIP